MFEFKLPDFIFIYYVINFEITEELYNMIEKIHVILCLYC